jgi:adenine phosphoribosyltransferase
MDEPRLSPDVDAWFKSDIASIADFPIPGIDFKDITPLLANQEKFAFAIEALAKPLNGLPLDAVIAVESRGFIVGAPLASVLRLGLVLARKPGKLPGERDSFGYTCEYCSGTLEVRRGSVRPGLRYLIVDDLLATGGTARATADYVSAKGGEVIGFCFLVELTMLEGRSRLLDGAVFSLLKY